MAGIYLVGRRSDRLPARGAEVSEEATRSFYRGLASLQVGLLDRARTGVRARHRAHRRGARGVGEPGPGSAQARRLRRRAATDRTGRGARAREQRDCLPARTHGNHARPARRGHCPSSASGRSGSPQPARPLRARSGNRARRVVRMPTPRLRSSSRSSSSWNRTTWPSFSNASVWRPDAASSRLSAIRSARLETRRAAWPAAAVEHYDSLRRAVAAQDFAGSGARQRLSQERSPADSGFSGGPCQGEPHRPN